MFYVIIYLFCGVHHQYLRNINIRAKHDVLVHGEQLTFRREFADIWVFHACFFFNCDTFEFIMLLICMWFIHFCLCSASSGGGYGVIFKLYCGKPTVDHSG